MLKISPAKSLFSSAALAIAVFCAGDAASAQADTLLRFRFEVGDKLDYECRSTANSSTVADGKTMTSKMQSTMMFSREAKSVDTDGKATVVVTINRVKMSMTMPMGPALEYDSAVEKEQEGMGKMLAEQSGQILGKPIEMKIDALGNISDVKLPEAMAGKQGLGTMFGGGNMKQMLGGISLPKEAVAMGKTWTASAPMPGVPGMGKGTIEQTYKYMGTESKGGEDIEKIELTATSSTTPAGNAPIKMTLKDQETKGDILFDNKAGRLQNAKTTSKVTLDMEMMGKSITNSVETTVEVKLLPKTGAK